MIETGKEFMMRAEMCALAKGHRLRDIYKAIPTISTANITMWRKGSFPNLATAIAIAKWCGTSVEYLATGENVHITSPDTDATVLALKARLRQIADIAEGRVKTKSDNAE